MLIENVNDIFPVTSLSTRNAYILIRILELLKRSEKIGKKFFEGDRHSKTNSKQGGTPLHKYALFMYICTFYALFRR